MTKKMFWETLNGCEVLSFSCSGTIFVDGVNKKVLMDGEEIILTLSAMKEVWNEYMRGEGIALEAALLLGGE